MEQRTRRPRIADVAREAGVSKTAVSFAFNSPDRLAPETASRIREIAGSLGYRPHPVARMLTQRRTMSIGVLTPQALSVIFSNPFFGAFSEGVALAAERSGYALHFISPLHGSLARAVGRATVDGVVVIGLAGNDPEVEQIRSVGLPIVLVDSTAMPEHDSVVVEDERGAGAAAEHLVDFGHREFLVIGVERPQPWRGDPGGVMARRLTGYRAALEAAAIDLPDDRIVTGPATIEGGLVAFNAAWSAGLRPTAVLAMSDAMAIGVMHAVRDLGLRVPGDVSVVGFDDIDVAPYVDPPLTTVHQPIRQKGEEAAHRLLALIDRSGEGGPQQHRFETRLVVRGSSGPAPYPRQEVDT